MQEIKLFFGKIPKNYCNWLAFVVKYRVRYFVSAQEAIFCILLNGFDRKRVEYLSKDAISRVLRAEAEANAIRERAAADARARVDACEKACIRAHDEAIAAHRDSLRAREASVKERADALIEQSRGEAGADIDVIRAAASDKMREAVKHIEWELCDI